MGASPRGSDTVVHYTPAPVPDSQKPRANLISTSISIKYRTEPNVPGEAKEKNHEINQFSLSDEFEST